MSRSRSILLCIVGATVWSTNASASNSLRPRTPAVFDADPCLIDVDRSVETNLRFGFDIPYEDTQLSEDELSDSRTLRFMLLSGPLRPGEKLPNWLDRADADRALEAGLVDARPPSTDVASEAPIWSDRIVVLPIEPRAFACGEDRTPEADVSGLPAGAYELWAYTFEPPLNLWTQHPGIVVIHDGQSAPPAAAIHTLVPVDDGDDLGIVLRGCASRGTSVRVSWIDSASAGFEDTSNWTPLIEETLGAPSIELHATMPSTSRGRGAFFRFEVERDGRFALAGIRGPVSFSQGSEGIAPRLAGGACGPDASEDIATSEGCATTRPDVNPGAIPWLLLLPLLRTRATRPRID